MPAFPKAVPVFLVLVLVLGAALTGAGARAGEGEGAGEGEREGQGRSILDRFVYYPTPLPPGWSAAESGIEGAEDCSFQAADGVPLAALFIGRADARATVLYLHGNGGNLTLRADAMARLAERARVNVLLLEYRGYGRSGGSPSEEGLYRDAEAAYDHLVAEHGATADRLLLYGHSLGCGVAVEIALRREVAGVVLEAPFTSIPDVVEEALPFLDAERLFGDRYDNLGKAPRLSVPLLVVHGTKDRTVPVRMGRAVAAAAGGPTRILEVEGAGHLDCARRAGEAYYGAVSDLLDDGLARKGAGAGRPALY